MRRGRRRRFEPDPFDNIGGKLCEEFVCEGRRHSVDAGEVDDYFIALLGSHLDTAAEIGSDGTTGENRTEIIRRLNQLSVGPATRLTFSLKYNGNVRSVPPEAGPYRPWSRALGPPG